MCVATNDADTPAKSGYYVLNTDGGMASDGHKVAGELPGVASIGVVLRSPQLQVIKTISRTIGHATHNEAEYQALIEGLRLVHQLGITRVRAYLDSELVVDQMNGRSRVKQPHLAQLHQQASALVEKLNFRVSWVPREMNNEADALARMALEAAVSGS
jgi:ribonuclease HI